MKIQDVRSYYEKMLAVTPEQIKAYNDNIDSINKENNYRVKDGIAIISIKGIINQYCDFWTWLFGGISTENINKQIDNALDDNSIQGIILDIDSVGGEVGGINDLAEKIYGARAIKPIVSYVSDTCASAGYWLGASAEKIITGKVALVGSIGVVASFENKKENKIDFVSSISPYKNKTADEPEGAQKIQQWVDDIGLVFVEAIARFRGKNVDYILKNFGGGDVMIAKKALTVGMIDEISNFKSALGYATKNIQQTIIPTTIKQEIGAKNKMTNKIFAKIKNGLKAELVIVDTDNADAVIPSDAIALSEIDVAWLEQNLPQLVEEIKQIGRDEENARQQDLNNVDPNITAPDPANDQTNAIMKKARSDTKIKAADTALELMKAIKGKIIPINKKIEQQTPHVPPANSSNNETDAEKQLAEFKAGAQLAAKKRLGAIK